MQRYSLKRLAQRQGIRRRVVMRPPGLRRALEHELGKLARDTVLPPFRQYRAILLLQAAADRPKMVRDSLTDILRLFQLAYSALIEQARGTVARLLTIEGARHSKDWQRAVNQSIGVDLSAVIDDADIRPQVELAVQHYVALIKGLTDDVQKRLANTLILMVARGASQREMAQGLSAEFDFAKTRAALIARDQAAKFSGGLNRVRQMQAGITEYEWSTSMDERVRGNPDGKYPNARPSHWAREGKRFAWNSPPSDGHPGEPINCRCVALAVLN